MTAYLEELAEKHKLEATPWNAALEAVEAEMLRRLLERKANNSKTEAGTFYKKDSVRVRVKDKVTFLDHLFTMRLNNLPNCYDMLTQAVAKDSVTEFMKENGGQPPPGIEVTPYSKINVRKA